jgi:hypothetical protein
MPEYPAPPPAGDHPAHESPLPLVAACGCGSGCGCGCQSGGACRCGGCTQ